MSVPPRSKKTAFSRAMAPTSGPLAPRLEVPPLVRRRGVVSSAGGADFRRGEGVVDLGGEGDAPPSGGARLPREDLRTRGLDREAHVHDPRGVALARREVHEPPLREE